MAVLQTAANPGRVFMPMLYIQQLRSTGSRDFGCGNIAAFRNTVRIAAGAGIRSLYLAPINETEPHLASPFSKSSNNALSPRIVALEEVPEIKNTPELRSELARQFLGLDQETAGTKMNIPLVDRQNFNFLMRAYDVFSRTPRWSGRKRDFRSFSEEQVWWLKPYSAFKTMEKLFEPIPMEEWDPAYADLSSRTAKAFLKSSEAKAFRGFYEFCQFETDRQVREALQYAHDIGIEEIELLMGVGVSRISAEAFLMGDIYDRSRQIGCLPEPENGYPLQLWGFPAKRSENPAALEFEVRSLRHLQKLGVKSVLIDHAPGVLGGCFTFPVYDETGRILKADNPDDEKYALANCKWDCDGIDPKDHAKKVLFSILERVPGMKLSAETVGDETRRVAAESAIELAIEQGYDMTLMQTVPWWDGFPTLHSYAPTDRLSLTHDMPALTALLTGRVGDHEYKWINGESVSGLLKRFGILSPQVNKTFDISELTPEFMYEVMKRIICGSSAGTVSIPLTTLLTMKIEFLDGGKWMCINIQPGTEGVVDESINTVGNFLQRMPAIENLCGLENQIGVLAAREPEYFDPPFDLMPVNPDDRFRCQVRKAGSSVAYQAANGKWTVWTPKPGEKPLWEMAFAYFGGDAQGEHEDKAWANYYVGDLGLDEHSACRFIDLSGNTAPFSLSGWALAGASISIGLNPSCSRHHFVILEQ